MPVTMPSLDDFAHRKLAATGACTPAPHAGRHRREDGIWVERDGRRLLSFSCNDYLNLSQHPAIIKAAVEAARALRRRRRRLAPGHRQPPALRRTGEPPGADQRRPRRPACSAPAISPIPASFRRWSGRGGLVLADELSHACIYAGAQVCAARSLTFRHNDVATMREALLAAHRAEHRSRADRHRWRILHGRRSGAAAELLALAKRTTLGCWRMTRTDWAWSAADAARALPAMRDAADVPLQMGTLSKAVGAYGGYLCASQRGDRLDPQSRAHVDLFDWPATACVAASIAALDLIEREPGYAAEPLRKARQFTRALNLPEPQSAIVPVILGETDAALAASRLLADEGFLVVAIRPPTVPHGTARLRFTFTAQHPDAEIARLAAIVRSRVSSTKPWPRFSSPRPGPISARPSSPPR